MSEETPKELQTPSVAADEPGAGGAKKKGNWLADAIAGLVGAVASVPDGLATATLVGVNPVYGLYACIFGPLAGSWLLSASLIILSTTSASGLAAGEAIKGYQGTPNLDGALFLFVFLIGIFQVLFGLLKLGKLTRFVAHSVMTGFLVGVALLLIFGQFPALVGYEGAEGNNVVQAIQTILAIGTYDRPTIIVSAITLVLLIGLANTRIGQFSSLVALVVPALVVALFDMDSVALVRDVSPIPRGIPVPALPDFSLFTPSLMGSAMAVAVVILVQGAGVGQSFPNRDGSRIDASKDFVAQGAGNFTSGLFGGIPVGASVGQTALNVTAGARTRMSGVFAGLWMLAIVLLIPGLVGYAPMAALAALMMLAGIQALRPREALSIWRTGWTSRISMLVTAIATLFLSIPMAVAIGVLLSIILYLASASTDVAVVQMEREADGRVRMRAPDGSLKSHSVTVLDIEGSLFFAGARRVEELLPSPRGSREAVVILRMRGRPSVGSTFVDVIDDYAEALSHANGKLYLSGVDPAVRQQIEHAGKLLPFDNVKLFDYSEYVGESTDKAIADAEAWLVEVEPSGGSEET